MEAELAAQRAVEAELEKLREDLVVANESFNTVQGDYYRLGADVARIEQAIQHSRESRQQQQQELQRAEHTLGEIGEHIERDSRRLEQMVQDIGAIEPELLTTGEQAEESANALQAAEQAMQDWREEWEDFNRRSAERSQSVQVERTRLDHLQRQMQQLDDRLLRMGQEQQNLDSNAPSDEVDRLIRTASEEEELAAAKQSLLMAAGQRINEIRSGIDLREQETVALQSTHHDLRGQLVRTLVDETRTAGQHSVVWDGRGAQGGFVSSGTYFSRLSAGGQMATQRMTLLK